MAGTLTTPEVQKPASQKEFEKLTCSFKVTVDYSRTLQEMIKAGNYGSVNSEITAEHFPVIAKGRVVTEIVVVHFNRNISSKDALDEMARFGLRAAALPELLAFGEAQPEVQQQFPVIALGSFWQGNDGNRGVPYLNCWDNVRWLGLVWFDDGWGFGCRFACVHR
jgi:hypothetical protein